VRLIEVECWVSEGFKSVTKIIGGEVSLDPGKLNVEGLVGKANCVPDEISFETSLSNEDCSALMTLQ
jgi:hypothetical protein